MDSKKNFGWKSADSNTSFENSTPNVTEPTMTGQEIPTKDYIQVPDFNPQEWMIKSLAQYWKQSIFTTNQCSSLINHSVLVG